MVNTMDGRCYFPEEFVSPKLKETNEYGLAYVKAMYYSSNRYGSTFFYGSSDFDSLVQLAQGRQSVDSIKKLFGYIDPNSPLNDGSNALAFLDIQVLNLAPKYINRCVAKIQKTHFDIGVNAIDIVSIDEKADYAAALDAFYRLKEWTTTMGFDPKALFPELDVDSLPQYPDEMEYDIMTNPKIKKEIEAELTIKLVQAINNFNQKMREVDWDLAVIGRGHLHCYNDHNGVPRVDRINPKFWIGSYVDNDNFEGQEYAGFFDFLTVSQFIKETSDKLTQDEQMEIVKRYSSTTPNNSYFVDYNRLKNFDGLGYIPVLKFYFLSEDNRTFVKKKNSYGNNIMLEQSFNYRPSREKADLYEPGGDRKMIKNTYTSVYGGTWVVDSDCVYGYGRKKYPRTNLVNATLPIKTFATNFKEGRTVSFASQMIEPLFMINVAWNKIKEILAKGYMGILEIDFNQLEDVAIGHGGKVWTPLDLMKLFLKKQILIKRGAVNKYDQKVGDAMGVTSGGLTLADYFTTLTMSINMLEQMTGTSAIESAEIPDRLAVRNAQMSQMTSDYDMEYLYNAHEYLYQRASHTLLLLAQVSKADGNFIRGFIPSLGKVNSGYYDVAPDIAYCEYGLFLTRQPTAEEWQSFYGDVSIAVQAGANGLPGGISLADSAYVREIDNLKQARQMLGVKQKQFERKMQAQLERNHQMQMEGNQQSAQLKIQGEMQKLQAQAQAEQELEILKGKIQERLQAQKAQADGMIRTLDNQTKKFIAQGDQQAEIVKQSIRNIPEKQKVESKTIDTMVKAQTEADKLETKKMEIKAKPKPVAVKKK
jgi:hypothetical protein